jgi:hypothetical protein
MGISFHGWFITLSFTPIGFFICIGGYFHKWVIGFSVFLPQKDLIYSMKKIVTAALAISLMICASCKKSALGPAGYWTFQGTTYDAESCSGGPGILNASNLNNNNVYTYGTIECNFYNNVLPSVPGTFYVVAYPARAANQIAMNISIGGALVNYNSTGSGTDTVAVTVAANGYVTVRGSGIIMLNASGGTDSSALALRLTQTQ